MLVEGYHIYKLLTEVFSNKRCGIIPYYAIGYGVPFSIVSASIACSEFMGIHGYGTEHHCWLTTDHGFIWSFIGPVAAVVAINMMIFIVAMTVARKAIMKKKNIDKKTELTTWLKGSLSLLSILGITWIFGFFYFNRSLKWMGAVFTVLNSLQGVAIFFFHVVLNDLAKKKLKSHLQRRFHLFQFTSMSRSDTTKHTIRKRILGRNQSEISFVEESISKSSDIPKQKDALELSDNYVVKQCTEESTEYNKTQGSSNFSDESEKRSIESKPTRNRAGRYGAMSETNLNNNKSNKNNNRYEPEPDY